jgi:hypothetical protein
LQLQIRRSRWLDFVQTGAYLAVDIGLALTDIPLLPKLSIILLLCLLLFQRLRTPQDLPDALKLAADGSLSWRATDDSMQTYEIDAGSTVLPWLIVLRLKGLGGKRSLTLLQDSMTADEYRQLSVWLRWQASIL